MFQGGWRLPSSKWANPFRLSDYAENRGAVLVAYEKYVRASPELMDSLHELAGKRLGCWCVEKRCLTCGKMRGTCGHLDCHGDVLVKLLLETYMDAAKETAEGASSVNSSDTVPDDDPLWAELGLIG